jgi:hypothetical protein
MGIGMLREQAAGPTRDQRNAFFAARLGWAMDAFDYFLREPFETDRFTREPTPAGQRLRT